MSRRSPSSAGAAGGPVDPSWCGAAALGGRGRTLTERVHELSARSRRRSRTPPRARQADVAESCCSTRAFRRGGLAEARARSGGPSRRAARDGELTSAARERARGKARARRARRGRDVLRSKRGFSGACGTRARSAEDLGDLPPAASPSLPRPRSVLRALGPTSPHELVRAELRVECEATASVTPVLPHLHTGERWWPADRSACGKASSRHQRALLRARRGRPWVSRHFLRYFSSRCRSSARRDLSPRFSCFSASARSPRLRICPR